MPAQAAGDVPEWYRRYVRLEPKFAETMGFTSVPETNIVPGAKLDINTFAVIPTVVINTSSGGAEANPFNFELAYDTGVRLRMIWRQESGAARPSQASMKVSSSPKQTHPTRSGRWSRIAKSCRTNSGRRKGENHS